MFKPEPGLIIWTVISFSFFSSFKEAGLSQILKAMKTREETIARQLEEARRQRPPRAASRGLQTATRGCPCRGAETDQ